MFFVSLLVTPKLLLQSRSRHAVIMQSCTHCKELVHDAVQGAAKQRPSTATLQTLTLVVCWKLG